MISAQNTQFQSDFYFPEPFVFHPFASPFIAPAVSFGFIRNDASARKHNING